MREYVKLLFIPLFRLLGLMLATELAVFFILPRLGCDPVSVFAMVTVLGLYAVPFVPLVFRATNLSWALGLPFSKRQLLAMHTAVNLSTVAVGLLAQAALIVFMAYLVDTPEERAKWPQELRTLAMPSKWPPITLAMIVYALAALDFLYLMCVRAGGQGTPKRVIPPKAMKRGVAYITFAGLVWVYLESHSLDYQVWPLLFIAAMMFPVEVAFMQLHIPKVGRLRYRLAAAAVAIAQLGAVYGIGVSHLRSTSPARVASAINILDLYAPEVDNDVLLYAMTASGDSVEDLKVLADYYRTHHREGFTPQMAVEGRKTTAAARVALSAIDLRASRLGAILPVFAWIDALPMTKKTPKELFGLYSALVVVPMDDAQMASLLDLPSVAAHKVAIARARFYRSEVFMKALQAKLPSLNPQEQDLARLTLALQQGVNPVRAPASEAGFFAQPDCKAIKNFFELASEATFNVCVRQIALERGPASVARLTDQEWVQLPLSSEQAKVWKQWLSPPRRPKP